MCWRDHRYGVRHIHAGGKADAHYVQRADWGLGDAEYSSVLC